MDLNPLAPDDAPDQVLLAVGIDALFEHLDDAFGEVGGVAFGFVEVELVQERRSAGEINAERGGMLETIHAAKRIAPKMMAKRHVREVFIVVEKSEVRSQKSEDGSAGGRLTGS